MSARRTWAGLALAALLACVTPPEEQLAREMAIRRAAPTTERLVMADWAQESWTLGSHKAVANIDLFEYVRPSERIDDWNELLTLMKFWTTSRTYPIAGTFTGPILPDPSTFTEAFRLAARNSCAAQPEFRRVEEETSGPYPSVTFYYACTAQKDASAGIPRAEAELVRVFGGGDGLYTVMRARRAASLDEPTQREWAAYLERFVLCDSAIADRHCPSSSGPP